jgi:hypothetical protein
MHDDESAYLNTLQAAHHLKMSPKALERLRVLGGGPVFRKHGGHVVYKRTELDEWSDSRRRNTTQEPHPSSDIDPPPDTSPPKPRSLCHLTPCAETSH